MIGIQGRAGERGPPRTGGLELGFKEQVGFGEIWRGSLVFQTVEGNEGPCPLQGWSDGDLARGLPLAPSPG